VADRLTKQTKARCSLFGFGLSEYNKAVGSGFLDAIWSHKNTRRLKRLEENLQYISLGPVTFKDEYDIRPATEQALANAETGMFASFDWLPYKKPENRWKTEELVYNIIKKQYKDEGVIYQHRPLFLRSSLGGQMSYDVYISGLKVAVEYQGRQHFEPIDFFGGTEAFEKTKLRDAEKKNLSDKNGIVLVYFNHWEDISKSLVIDRIQDAINGR